MKHINSILLQDNFEWKTGLMPTEDEINSFTLETIYKYEQKNHVKLHIINIEKTNDIIYHRTYVKIEGVIE